MSNAITIEEAVARMVNVSHIPIETDLIEFLNACAGNAENEYDKAKKDGLPDVQLELLQLRINACDLRYKLAKTIKQHMEWELQSPPKIAFLKRSSDTSVLARLELESVAEWADYHYGIGRLDYEELGNAARETPMTGAEKEAIKISEEGLSPKVIQRLFITFAYLVEAFVDAKKNPVGFGTPDNPIVLQVAETLHQRAVEFHHGAAKSKETEAKKNIIVDKVKNFDIETLKGRIEIARAMKKLFGKNV